MAIYLVLGWVFQALSYLPLMGLSDSSRPLEIFAWLPFRVLPFGLTFEGKGLLELLWDVKGIEMSLIPGNLLKEDNRYSDIITRVR